MPVPGARALAETQTQTQEQYNGWLHTVINLLQCDDAVWWQALLCVLV